MGGTAGALSPRRSIIQPRSPGKNPPAGGTAALLRLLLSCLALFPPGLLAQEDGRSLHVDVAWSPQGSVLISSNQLLARFDFDAGTEELLADGVVAFALSPAGDRLAVARGEGLEMFDYPGLARRPPLASPPAGGITTVAWSPAGETLAAGTREGRILLWDMPAGDLWADLSVDPAGPLERLRFSRDGRRLLTAFLDGRAVLWDLEQRRVVHRFDWPREAGSSSAPPVATSYVDLSPDGRRVLANRVRAGDAKIVLLDDRGRVRWSQEGYASGFTPDGSRILALAPPFRIAVLYPVEGEARALRVFQPPGTVEVLFLVRVSPDQKRLLGVGEDARGQVLLLWDFQTGWLLHTHR